MAYCLKNTQIYMWIRESMKHIWQTAQIHSYQGKLKKLLEVTEFCLSYTCLKIFWGTIKVLIWLSFLCILLEDPQIYLTPDTWNVKRHCNKFLTLTWAEFIPVSKVCWQNFFSSWCVRIIDHLDSSQAERVQNIILNQQLWTNSKTAIFSNRQ